MRNAGGNLKVCGMNRHIPMSNISLFLTRLLLVPRKIHPPPGGGDWLTLL